MSEELVAEADALYGLALGDFTAARDARFKELKTADAALAARVKTLRKPAVAAWVVNLLVRRESAQVEQLLTVGAALREAQATLDAEQLRELTRQRRQLTAAVASRARALAAEEGHRVTESVGDAVEATLTAAMLDAGAAAAVRTGLLVAPLQATGVEAVDAGAALAVPEAAGFTATPRAAVAAARPDLRVVPDPEPDLRAREAAEAALAEASEGLSLAVVRHDEAAAEVSQWQAKGMQIQAELDELRRRVAALETDAENADDALTEAEDTLSSADTDLAAAQVLRDRAQAVVDNL